MTPDKWDADAITPHLSLRDAASCFRVLPPEYLVVNRFSGDRETARHARNAIRRSRENAAHRHTQVTRKNLTSYDNALAFAFKYPRCQGDGRFNTSASAGVLYASFQERTALAERAYQQVRLLREKYGALTMAITMIGVTRIAFDIQPCWIADVTSPPFNTHPGWSSPDSDYQDTQIFADNARKSEAAGVFYSSARDRVDGTNLALFDYQCLAQRQLDRRRLRDWFMSATATTVDMQTSAGAHERFLFDRYGAPCPP